MSNNLFKDEIHLQISNQVFTIDLSVLHWETNMIEKGSGYLLWYREGNYTINLKDGPIDGILYVFKIKKIQESPYIQFYEQESRKILEAFLEKNKDFAVTSAENDYYVVYTDKSYDGSVIDIHKKYCSNASHLSYVNQLDCFFDEFEYYASKNILLNLNFNDTSVKLRRRYDSLYSRLYFSPRALFIGLLLREYGSSYELIFLKNVNSMKLVLEYYSGLIALYISYFDENFKQAISIIDSILNGAFKFNYFRNYGLNINNPLTNQQVDLFIRTAISQVKNPLITNPLFVNSVFKVENREMNLGNYVQTKESKSGGFGEVLFINCAGTDYAVKIAFPGHEEFLMKEVSCLKLLDHPNVVKCVDYGYIRNNENKRFFAMKMEYYPQNLEEFINTIYLNNQMTKYLFECIFGQICNVFQYLICERGMVHRDLKLANILVQTVIKENVVFPYIKICDFGVARYYDTSMATYAGTPITMWEKVENGVDYDERCDLYSLGCCLYYLMCNCYHEGNPKMEDIKWNSYHFDEEYKKKCWDLLVKMTQMSESKIFGLWKVDFNWNKFFDDDIVKKCMNAAKNMPSLL